MFKIIKFENIANKNYNILEDSKNYMLCLLGIESSDAKTDHAITIVGDWIFDLNCERAIRLSMKSLNICSSSSTRKSTFVKVTRGYLLKKR